LGKIASPAVTDGYLKLAPIQTFGIPTEIMEL
jgi:hypothetical protein